MSMMSAAATQAAAAAEKAAAAAEKAAVAAEKKLEKSLEASEKATEQASDVFGVRYCRHTLQHICHSVPCKECLVPWKLCGNTCIQAKFFLRTCRKVHTNYRQTYIHANSSSVMFLCAHPWCSCTFDIQDEASKALKILLKGDDREPKADAPKLVVRQNIAQSDALKGEVSAQICIPHHLAYLFPEENQFRCFCCRMLDYTDKRLLRMYWHNSISISLSRVYEFRSAQCCHHAAVGLYSTMQNQGQLLSLIPHQQYVWVYIYTPTHT